MLTSTLMDNAARWGVGWKKARGGQTKTRHQFMKSLTIELICVNRCRLLGWGLNDYRNQWLKLWMKRPEIVCVDADASIFCLPLNIDLLNSSQIFLCFYFSNLYLLLGSYLWCLIFSVTNHTITISTVLWFGLTDC